MEKRFTFYDYETPYYGNVKIIEKCESPKFYKDTEDIGIYVIGNNKKEFVRLIAPDSDKAQKELMKLNLGDIDVDNPIVASGGSSLFFMGDTSFAELNTIDVEGKVNDCGLIVSYRRQGLGSEIIKLTAANISKKGVKQLFVISAPKDYGVMEEDKRKKFYYSLGFAPATQDDMDMLCRESKRLLVADVNCPKLRNSRSVRDDYLTDRVADILREK
jgi:hypothetical protein